MITKKWNDHPLQNPIASESKDEIRNITSTLVEQHGMSEKGIRQVAHKVLRPRGRIRSIEPILTEGGMRYATDDDLCQDLETAVKLLGNSRSAQSSITRGLKDVAINAKRNNV